MEFKTENEAAKYFNFENPGSLTYRERMVLNNLLNKRYVDDDPNWSKYSGSPEIKVTVIDGDGNEIKDIAGSYQIYFPDEYYAVNENGATNGQ